MPPTPASQAHAAYTASPFDVRAPPNTFLSAVTCAGDRHVSDLAPLHVIADSFGATTAVVQDTKLCTRPSAAPSIASQASSTARDTSARSSSVNALFTCGWPLASTN